MDIDHTTKTIVYSDGLTVDKALGLKKQCDEVGFTGSLLSDPNWVRGDHWHHSGLRNRDFTLERFQVDF